MEVRVPILDVIGRHQDDTIIDTVVDDDDEVLYHLHRSEKRTTSVLHGIIVPTEQ